MTKLNQNSIAKKAAIVVRRTTILTAALFCILILTGIEAAAQSDQCGVLAAQAVTRVSTNYTDAQTGAYGYSSYDILSNGETDHYIHLFYDAPDNTVFKAYFNGTEIATLDRFPASASHGEFWTWEGYQQPHPVGHVGDVMSITRDGQPFLTGSYTRETVDYEAADGGFAHAPTGTYPCSLVRAQVFLPTSANPRMLRIYRVIAFTAAPAAATRITLNEPDDVDPSALGPVIAELPITTVMHPPDWVLSQTAQNDVTLTENQFILLRQGALYATVYDATHSDGLFRIPITTQGINSGSDLEGDGIADLAVFRPNEQMWYTKYSSNQEIDSVHFGHANDTLVVGDYDADRKADLATFQPDDPNYPGKGVWNIIRSSDSVLKTIQWGISSDIPLKLNIDKNNTNDLGVFRPEKGTWYIMRMGDIIKPLARTKDKSAAPENNGQQFITLQWGIPGDKPLVGDFDRDGVDELVVFRPSDGNWYIYNYAHNTYQIFHWGMAGDIPMARDFDGDGKADMAVYRPSSGAWYIYGSLENNVIIRNLGASGDLPVPADYDKDSVTDIAVFRPRSGMWYVLTSSDNGYFSTKFGSNGDIPAVAPR